MASGSCQARDETLADRIGNLREDSRDGLGLPPQGHRCRRTGGKEDIRRQAYEFLREGVHALDIAGGVAMVDLDIASLGPSKRGEPLHKMRDAGTILRVAFGIDREYADPPHPLALLRARRNGPERRYGETGDELASSHGASEGHARTNDAAT